MLYSPEDLKQEQSDLTRLIGGKGSNVLTLWREGFAVPRPLFISTEYYEEFVNHNGMLIHGAIIAREYGIPCITGVVEASSYIITGDIVTVDGFLGICTIQRTGESQDLSL